MGLLDAPFDPAHEAALVTGAGNGIGRAIAQALVSEGVRTIFADVSEERVMAAIKSSSKPELATPFVGDLADRKVCEALLARAPKAVGRVTHFVHSASPPRREADHDGGRSAVTEVLRLRQRRPHALWASYGLYRSDHAAGCRAARKHRNPRAGVSPVIGWLPSFRTAPDDLRRVAREFPALRPDQWACPKDCSFGDLVLS